MQRFNLIIAIIITIFTAYVAGETDPNKLEDYYGFNEIEIIKLDPDISELTIADFDGNGKNDIAIANNRKARIEILLQKEALGAGEEETAVDPQDADINALVPPTRFKKDSLSVSQRVFSLACGDLNADGKTDLVFWGDPAGLYVILQKSDKEKTGLSWKTISKINIEDGLPSSGALICADLNNDKKDDLALAGQDSIYIILQKKDGSLAEPVKYPTSVHIRELRAGDLNGDGINDLIIITDESEKPIQVRFGLPTGQLGPQIKFFIEVPYDLKVYDIDSDKADEILTVDARSGRLICYKLNSQKELNKSNEDWPIAFYPLVSGKERTDKDLVTGDFDGDGLVDIVISDPGAAELILYRQIAKLGLAEPVKFPAFTAITNLSAADIDNDKKTEIAVLSVNEKIAGLCEFKDERLSFPEPLNLTGEPLALELEDIDKDGKTDLIYISKDANDTKNLRVNYDLASDIAASKKKPADAKDEKAKVCYEVKLSSNPEGIKIADIDQDGLKDVLIFQKYEPIPVVIRQTQKGKFEVVDSPKAQSSLLTNATVNSISVGNVDEKAGETLLSASQNFARSLIFSEGKWKIKDQYNAKDQENKIATVGAFNLDEKGWGKKPAILLLDVQKGKVQILKSGEDKIYRLDKEINVGNWSIAKHLKMLFEPLMGSKTKSILIFDGDKFAIITPPASDNMLVLEQQFSYETKIQNGTYAKLAAGDLNNDKWCDVAMVEYSKNHIEILGLDGQNKPVVAMRFKTFEDKSYRGEQQSQKSTVEPREIQINDVTGDAKNDLVSIIHDRIIIYPQD